METASTRDRMVDGMIELMRHRGVAASGVAELIRESNVARRSVYLHFPQGKNQLLAAATASAGQRVGGLMRDQGDEDTPEDVIYRATAFCRKLLTDDYSGGCPVVAATLGRAVAPEAHEAAAGAFRHWRETLAATLVTHGYPSANSEGLAETIIAAIEGALIMCQAACDTSALDHLDTTLPMLLANATEVTADLPERPTATSG